MLRNEILDNLKQTLVGLHGAKTCDPAYYHRLLAEGLTPEEAWSLFEKTIREVDCWTELDDIDELMEEKVYA